MNYKEEYRIFLEAMETGAPIPPEQVGRLIVKLAQSFSDVIAVAVKAEHAYNRKLAEFEQSKDEAGKALSSTKAESQAKATAEYLAYITAKGDLSGIEQMINGLKSLQKSLQNDFSYQGI
jgi:thiaminase